ncbi:MAG: acyltransferase [Prevotella sp.]|nr:acyltransferase [Prevotella sp.]
MLSILLSIPQTVIFNFRYLPFTQALKLPVWIHYRCKVKIEGHIECESSKLADIRIGFHTVSHLYRPVTSLMVSRGARLVFKGSAHIGRGSSLLVYPSAVMELGTDFTISAASTLKCYKKIAVGDNVLCSWDILIMDSDTHSIVYSDGQENNDKPIIISDHVWIGCNSVILKGAEIPENCVIGAGSVVSGKYFEKNSIIAGNPAKTIKNILSWRK